MFQMVELQRFEDGFAEEATVYRVAFERLSTRIQEQVVRVFTQPRSAVQREAGSEYYRLIVEGDEGARFAAEYNEDSAHPQTLDMLDTLIEEIEACAAADRAPT